MTDPYRRFSVRLHEHTGIVLFWVQRSITCTGTLEQCEKAYRDAQRHCLVTGWWGLVSFFLMNPIALISNYTAIRRVRAQAKEAPAPHLATPYAPAGQAAPAVAPRQAVAPHPAAPPRPVGPPPGWYPDPGGPGQRYWDGVAWTHWTHPR